MPTHSDTPYPASGATCAAAAAGSALMDPVADLLGGGRTVAYKTVLAHVCGGATVGLLLSQLWYWTNVPTVRERDGWFWKTMEEITEETGLTRSEQESARKKLKQLGVLVEEFRELPRKLYFRIDKARLYQVLHEHARARESTPPPEGRDPALYNAGNPHYGSAKTRTIARGKPAASSAGNPQPSLIQEKTTTTTAEKTAADSVGGRFPTDPTDAPATDAVADSEPKEAEPEPELVQRLIDAGVGKTAAQRLAAAAPDECRRQLLFLPHVTEFKTSRGAYLRKAIEEGFGPPRGWEAAQAKQEKQATAHQRKAEENARDDARIVQAAIRRNKIEELKRSIQETDPKTWAELSTKAVLALPPPIRNRPEGPAYKAAMERNIDDLLLSLYPG